VVKIGAKQPSAAPVTALLKFKTAATIRKSSIQSISAMEWAPVWFAWREESMTTVKYASHGRSPDGAKTHCSVAERNIEAKNLTKFLVT
jgi:hypothetical protein